jgi:hypothetical protein
MSPTVRNVLLGARWLLDDPVHWRQGEAFDAPPVGRACLTEACALFGLPPGHQEIPWCYVSDAVWTLARALDLCAADLMAWNDAPERTHAEVIALLDRVLADAA